MTIHHEWNESSEIVYLLSDLVYKAGVGEKFGQCSRVKIGKVNIYFIRHQYTVKIGLQDQKKREKCFLYQTSIYS